MPSKTVNLSVEAYEAAAAAKRPGESFSDLMLRTFRPSSLLDLVGALSDEEAARWKEDLADSRRRSRERSDRIDRMWVE